MLPDDSVTAARRWATRIGSRGSSPSEFGNTGPPPGARHPESNLAALWRRWGVSGGPGPTGGSPPPPPMLAGVGGAAVSPRRNPNRAVTPPPDPSDIFVSNQSPSPRSMTLSPRPLADSPHPRSSSPGGTLQLIRTMAERDALRQEVSLLRSRLFTGTGPPPPVQ
eukprot:Hpha_TRINITY_DN36559_c0_g1::TRINITY_DN36559_c0_g1_i1::g.130690::m.130690